MAFSDSLRTCHQAELTPVIPRRQCCGYRDRQLFAFPYQSAATLNKVMFRA
jgi:hypothetical protein